MYQTFYIDIDEEIASVIDRLRRSPCTENFFVIPKRALVIQSIVNLKLIKREAEKAGKQAVIVTQDEIGQTMAQKAGIPLRLSTEGLEVQKIVASNDFSKQEIVQRDFVDPKQSNQHVVPVADKRGRLSVVGSDDFFGKKEKTVSNFEESSIKTSYESRSVAKTKRPSDGLVRDSYRSQNNAKVVMQGQPGVYPSKGIAVNKESTRAINGTYQQEDPLDSHKEQRIEKMFQVPKENSQKIVQPQIPLGKRSKRFVFVFVLLCLVVLGGVAGYVLIPNAKVVVAIENQKKKMDVSIVGKAESPNVASDSTEIPLRIIERDESVTMEYSTTGTANSNGQKAKGRVAISNEYSDSSQQLVATTRLRSADGKIFRITKDIVVPGMNTVGGEKVAGVVEAEVMADQPGSEYNVDPTSFVIPGFEGGPKFEKFSAKSNEKMNGGATDGNSAKSVSQEDLANAKKKTEELMKSKIKEKLSAELGENEVLLDDAIEVAAAGSAATAKVGEVRETFDYVVKVNIKVVIFSRKDVENIVRFAYDEQDDSKGSKGDIKTILLDYAAVTPRFAQKDLSMKVHAEVVTKPKFDVEAFKKEVLGKDSQQIQQMLPSYPQIGNINIEFQPKFISRIPQYASQVVVEVVEK